MERPDKPKRIYLINREFQFRFMRSAIAVGLVSTIMTAFVVLYPLYTFRILQIPKFLPLPILLGMGSALVVNVSCLAVFAVMVSHRIAGPMFAVVRHLRRLGAGKWDRMMHIRDEDELKYVVRNVNDLTESLGFLARKDIQVVSLLRQQMDRLKDDPSVAEQISETLASLEREFYLRVDTQAGDGA